MTAQIIPFHHATSISCPTCSGPVSLREAEVIDGAVAAARSALDATWERGFAAGAASAAVLLFVLALALRAA